MATLTENVDQLGTPIQTACSWKCPTTRKPASEFAQPGKTGSHHAADDRSSIRPISSDRRMIDLGQARRVQDSKAPMPGGTPQY